MNYNNDSVNGVDNLVQLKNSTVKLAAEMEKLMVTLEKLQKTLDTFQQKAQEAEDLVQLHNEFKQVVQLRQMETKSVNKYYWN